MYRHASPSCPGAHNTHWTCVCVRARVRMCVCVCERERENERVIELSMTGLM